jgi:hypothetical protein
VRGQAMARSKNYGLYTNFEPPNPDQSVEELA